MISDKQLTNEGIEVNVYIFPKPMPCFEVCMSPHPTTTPWPTLEDMSVIQLRQYIKGMRPKDPDRQRILDLISRKNNQHRR